MRAGRLRHRIRIEQQTVVRDSFGGTRESSTWSTFETLWASIEPLRGREYWEAAAHNPEITVKFSFRYLSGVTPDMRIIDDDNFIYDIQAPIHIDHRRREMEVIAKNTNQLTTHLRLLESGDLRLLESGDFRVLEG